MEILNLVNLKIYINPKFLKFSFHLISYYYVERAETNYNFHININNNKKKKERSLITYEKINYISEYYVHN